MYRFRWRHLKLVGGSFYIGASYTDRFGHIGEFIPVPAVEAWLKLTSRRWHQDSNTGSNPVGATTPKLLKFSPQSLGAVGGGTRIAVSIPVVLVELADHFLQI